KPEQGAATYALAAGKSARGTAAVLRDTVKISGGVKGEANWVAPIGAAAEVVNDALFPRAAGRGRQLKDNATVVDAAQETCAVQVAGPIRNYANPGDGSVFSIDEGVQHLFSRECGGSEGTQKSQGKGHENSRVVEPHRNSVL